MVETRIPATIPPDQLSNWGMTSTDLLVTTDEDGQRKEHTLRLFIPSDSSKVSCEICTPFFDRLCEAILNSEGEERRAHERLFSLIKLHCLHPQLDHPHRREFHVSTLDRAPTLKILAHRGQFSNDPAPSKLLRLAGKTTDTSRQLMRTLRYEEPEILLPTTMVGYKRFKESILDEVTNMASWAYGQTDAEHDVTRQVDPPSDSPSTYSTSDDAIGAAQQLERMILTKALKMERERSKAFAPLVAEAEALMEPVHAALQNASLPMFANDEESPSEAYCSHVEKLFNFSAADDLLDRIAKHLVALYDLPTIDIMTVDEADQCTLDKIRVADAEQIAKEFAKGHEDEMQMLIALRYAKASQDVREKWNALVGVVDTLVNMEECLRLLLREARDASEWSQEYGFREFYRAFRGWMSRAEQRVFALMYFRIPSLGLRLAALDPVIRSFFTGMDKDTQNMIVGQVVLKVDPFEEGWGDALEERWRAFLRFYPTWLEILRSDERENYRDSKDEVRHIVYEDRLDDSAGSQSRQFDENLRVLARRFCTERENECFAHLALGLTEAETGAEMGISQQAVHQLAQRGVVRIRRGLRHKAR